MKLPNKNTPYRASILPKLVILLRKLETSAFSPSELYHSVSSSGITLAEYIDALDALYLLGRVEIDESGRIIYAENASM